MRITRRAEEEGLLDLIERPPRAHIAYVRDGYVRAAPVAARRADGGWLVRGAEPMPAGPAMLLIDDGAFYFELRGVRYPGVLEGAEDGRRDQRFVPERAIGWDYGAMRSRDPR